MFPIFDTNLWFSSIHCEPTHQSLCPLPSKKWKQLRTIEVTIPQGFSKLWLSLAGSFLLFYFLLHPGRWPHSTLWYCNKSVHKDAFWQLYYRCPLIFSQIWNVQKRWICGAKLLRNLYNLSPHGLYMDYYLHTQCWDYFTPACVHDSSTGTPTSAHWSKSYKYN